jgi:hypothetical protein
MTRCPVGLIAVVFLLPACGSGPATPSVPLPSPASFDVQVASTTPPNGGTLELIQPITPVSLSVTFAVTVPSRRRRLSVGHRSGGARRYWRHLSCSDDIPNTGSCVGRRHTERDDGGVPYDKRRLWSAPHSPRHVCQLGHPADKTTLWPLL